MASASGSDDMDELELLVMALLPMEGVAGADCAPDVWLRMSKLLMLSSM